MSQAHYYIPCLTDFMVASLGILSAAGIQGNFSSHRFWTEAATVVARNGIPDHQIQALGHWTSSAYLLYICTPAELLSPLSKQLSLLAAH